MIVFAIFDLALAAVYVWLGFFVAPSRSLAFNVALATLSALCALGGAGLLFRAGWGRVAAAISSLLRLAFAALILILLVISSAFLKATYGSLGQGMVVLGWLAAALVIELFALEPWFELRFLLRTRRK